MFPKAKLTRFNENKGCGPPVGAYDPSDEYHIQGVLQSNVNRFKDHKKDSNFAIPPAPSSLKNKSKISRSCTDVSGKKCPVCSKNVQNLADKISNLEFKLKMAAVKKDEQRELESKHNTLTQDFETIQDQMKKSEENINKITNELSAAHKTLKKQNDQSDNETARYQTMMQQLSAYLSSNTEVKEKADRDAATHRQQIKRLEKQLKSQKTEIEIHLSQKTEDQLTITDLNTRINTEIIKCQDSEVELVQSNERIREINADLDMMKVSHTQHEDRLHTRNTNLIKILASIEMSVLERERELSAAKRLSDEHEDKLTKECERLRRENSDLEIALSKEQHVSQCTLDRLASVESSLSITTTDISKQHATISELTQEQSRLTTESQTMKLTLNSRSNEIADLTAKKVIAEELVDTLSTLVGNTSERYTELETQHVQVELKLKATEEQNSQLLWVKEENLRQRELIENRDEELNKLSLKIEETYLEIDKLNKKITFLCKDHETTVDRYINDINNFSKSSKILKVDIANRECSSNEDKDELSWLKDQLAADEENEDNSQVRIKQLEDEIARISTEVNISREDDRVKLNEYENINCALNAKYEEYKNKFETLEERIKPFKDQIEQLELDNLKNEENRFNHKDFLTMGSRYGQLIGHNNLKQKIHHMDRMTRENRELTLQNNRMKALLAHIEETNKIAQPRTSTLMKETASSRMKRLHSSENKENMLNK